jgi:hypothetical protein
MGKITGYLLMYQLIKILCILYEYFKNQNVLAMTLTYVA